MTDKKPRRQNKSFLASNIFKISLIFDLIIIALVANFFLNKNRGESNESNSEQINIMASPYPITVPNQSFSAPNLPVINGQKTYQSQRFPLKFKFPAKYVLVNEYEDIYENQGHIQLYKPEDYQALISPEGVAQPPLIEFSVFKNLEKYSPLEWAKTHQGPSNFSGIYDSEVLAGQEALSYAWEGMMPGITRLVSKGDYIYIFTTVNDPEMSADFFQILETVEIN